MFIYLVVDLARDRELRARFEQNPGAVLEDYLLSKEEEQILVAGEREGLEAELRSQLSGLLDRLHHHNVFLPWPAPPINLKKVSPEKGPLGKVIPFEMTGSYFPPSNDAQVMFTKGLTKVFGKDVEVDNPGNESSSLTTNATFSVAGTYDVTVSSKPQPDSSSALAQIFTAEP
ncbi:MAG TPA: hypothetical protein VE078_09640 [Thermoanaerobaculia bacterium]|nr:hypothetical protein [Thermoanaerobaculia bacterium]